MKLEQNDKQLLFSETQVPDIFFTDYLPELPGDYLKIYLYLVFLSNISGCSSAPIIISVS